MFKNIDELPEGGMGLKIMLDIADSLSYTRTSDGRNCLLIVKKYEQHGVNSSQVPQQGNIFQGVIDLFKRLNGNKDKHQPPMSCDLPLQNILLQVNTDLKAVNQVLNWYDQLENLPIPRTVFLQCQLALVEGFTNTVRHAHQGKPLETPIDLEATVYNERLEMRIWDYGPPFDLEEKLSKIKELKQNPIDKPSVIAL